MHIIVRFTAAVATAAMAAIVLVGCATTTPLTVTAGAADIIGLSNAAQAFITALPPGTTVPATVTTALAEVSKIAATVAANPVSATASNAQIVVSDIESVLPLLTPLASAAGPYGPIALAAVDIFLPVIAQDFNLSVPAAAARGISRPVGMQNLADARSRYWPE